jgi:hypothetical protein
VERGIVSNTPISDLALQTDFPDFVTALAARLRVGADDANWRDYVTDLAAKLHHSKSVYGDGSFHLSPLEYVRETIAEAVDIGGWPFLMYSTRPELREAALEIATDGYRIFCRLKDLIRKLQGGP